MEEMPPAVSVTLGNHVDFTRMKLFTETASLLSEKNINGDIMIPETDADEIMSVGDEQQIEINTSVSVPIAVAIEGIDNGQIVAKVISLEAEHTLKASVVTIGEKNQTKVLRSVFELEYLPLWGSHSVCGKRPEMEDAVVAVPQFMQVPIKMFVADHVIDRVNPNLSDLTAHFFGVYDGHGGSQVFSYLSLTSFQH